MNILIVTYSGYGNWFSLRFEDEGHNVDIYQMNKKYKDVLSGICPEPLFDKPDFARYDLVLFDVTGKPKLAEEAVSITAVIGDGDLQTELEDDRMFGIQVMEQCGIGVPPYETFDNINEAKKFVKKTGKRYVFKPNGGQEQDTATTYVAEDAEDLLRYFDKLSASTHGVEFLLQEVVDGTEISTEAWFNGEDFFLLNATLEEKKFMNDRKGPNTGCSGNLVWMYNRLSPPRIFTEGLGKLKDFLREYNYRGMIDLNTIVSNDQLYGLEWTPRFGYDASATLFALIKSDLGQFMLDIASGNSPIYTTEGKFGAAVRLSIPPYPSEIKGHHPFDVPINGISETDAVRNCFLYDAMVNPDDDTLVTAGASGFIACPIYTGDTIYEAFGKVYEKIKHIKIPDMQFRTDLLTCCFDRYELLQRQGWIGEKSEYNSDSNPAQSAALRYGG